MKAGAFAVIPHTKSKGKEVELEIMPLVRCKDCKHLIEHYGFMDDGYCKKMQEDYNVKLKPEKCWFCADGEERE